MVREEKEFDVEAVWQKLIAVRNELASLKDALRKTLSKPEITEEPDPWLTEEGLKNWKREKFASMKEKTSKEIAQIAALQDKLYALTYEIESAGDDTLTEEDQKVARNISEMINRKTEQVDALDAEINALEEEEG